MAEPMRLHSLALHLGVRAVTGTFAIAAVGMAVAMVVQGKAEPAALAGFGFFALMLVLIYRTLWRTRAVRLDGDHLEVGRGPDRRRIHVGDILSVDRPWWAFPDRLAAPLEIVVRDGPPVLFFPALAAPEILAMHRARAAQRS